MSKKKGNSKVHKYKVTQVIPHELLSEIDSSQHQFNQKLIRKRGKIVHEMECQYDEMHKDAIVNDKKIRDELTALKTS